MVWTPASAIERARERVRAKLRDALPEHRYAGVLIALAIGDQRAIETVDWETFTRTGVGHLMSISGLHVTMVAGLFAALAAALWRRSARLALRLPVRKAAAVAAVLAAACRRSARSTWSRSSPSRSGSIACSPRRACSPPRSRSCCSSTRGRWCRRASGCRSAQSP
jgi:hypothetical protein